APLWRGERLGLRARVGKQRAGREETSLELDALHPLRDRAKKAIAVVSQELALSLLPSRVGVAAVPRKLEGDELPPRVAAFAEEVGIALPGLIVVRAPVDLVEERLSRGDRGALLAAARVDHGADALEQGLSLLRELEVLVDLLLRGG